MERRECSIRDTRETLLTAWDPMEMKEVSPDDIIERFRKQKFLLQCPECKEKVSPVCGLIRAHHFRHFRDGGTREKSDKKNDVGGPSAWHRLWQQRFPKDCREKKVTNSDGEARRGDVLLRDDNIVIEIQKADFTGFLHDEARSRTAFWNGLGYKIIWMFCLEEQSGYLGLPDDADKSPFRPMKMYLENFDKLIAEYDREKIEIHFLDLHGNVGYEFVPISRNEPEMVMEGVAVESYFLPYAPIYDKDMEYIRTELPESRLEIVDPEKLKKSMEESERVIEGYLKSLAEERERKKEEREETLYDHIQGKAVTLYDLIARSVQKGVKVLIVTRPNKSGTDMDEYQIFPGDYAYFIEKYASYPQYTFHIKGKLRRSGYSGYIPVDEIFSADKEIWLPQWAVNYSDEKMDVKEVFG